MPKIVRGGHDSGFLRETDFFRCPEEYDADFYLQRKDFMIFNESSVYFAEIPDAGFHRNDIMPAKAGVHNLPLPGRKAKQTKNYGTDIALNILGFFYPDFIGKIFFLLPNLILTP